MSTYAPILAPAMELIEKLQGIVAVQQAELAAMQVRINELSAQLGLPPMSVSASAASVHSTAAPAASEQAVSDSFTPEPVSTDDAAPAGQILYADMPLVIDGKGAFEADYLT
ncbi:MAG: hypothetical protein K2L77_05155, partial [Muribaculaceae bacterium]|nr:hypothetical protein [Muribaculaceae bacterium]